MLPNRIRLFFSKIFNFFIRKNSVNQDFDLDDAIRRRDKIEERRNVLKGSMERKSW